MKRLFCLLTLLTIGKSYAQSNIKVNEKAPTINITNWIENIPNDKNLNDKYIVLEFWATWCGPCIAAVPHMNNLQNEFNQNDLYYISITDESVEKVQRSLKRIDFASIVVTDLTKETQINFGDGVEGLERYPLTVLIDNDNIIRWIGEPKNLDAKIMSRFLNSKSEVSKTIKKEENTSANVESKSPNFISLFKNKEIAYYFDFKETEYKSSTKQTIGTTVISLSSYNLQKFYNEFLNIGSERLEIPNYAKTKYFDILYKNTNGLQSITTFEQEVLTRLGLTKQISLQYVKENKVSIKDYLLLEKTLEKEFSSKSGAGDKIIFTAYTIDEVLNEITKTSSVQFQFDEKDDTKYDFIIGIKTENEIIESLQSYGLAVEQDTARVEYIKLIAK